MSTYIGKICDKRGKVVYVVDSRIPEALEVEYKELRNKKFNLVWVGELKLAVPKKDINGKSIKNERGYEVTEDIYQMYDEFTPVQPRRLISKSYLIKGYVENSLGMYEFKPNWGFVEKKVEPKIKTNENIKLKQNKPVNNILKSKPVQKTTDAVGAGLSLTWTLICTLLALMWVFPQCF